MGRALYYEPSFYIVNDRFKYTIRGEIDLREEVDGTILENAVQTAFGRFPYFSVQVVRKDEEYLCIPNDRPHLILHSPDRVTLGSEQVNYHLVSVSWFENKIFFDVSHCLTDGVGRAPFTKSVLYYYLTEKYHIELDTEGIYLANSPLFEDEAGNPYPEDKIEETSSVDYLPIPKSFKLSDGAEVGDNIRTEYRVSAEADSFMRVTRSMNASPSSVVSALMAKITWDINPDLKETVVCNVCFNQRPGINNKHSFRPMYGVLPVVYQSQMKYRPWEELSRYSREMIRLQNTPENALYQAGIFKKYSQSLLKVKTIKRKRSIRLHSLFQTGGLLSSTFNISYVGRSSLGVLEPYVEAIYTSVDSSLDGGILIEITSVKDRFFFTFIQDFSTDIYVRKFLEYLKEYGVEAELTWQGPIQAGGILLPEENYEGTIEEHI